MLYLVSDREYVKPVYNEESHTMSLNPWQPPAPRKPSSSHVGHATQDEIYLAVGRALSRWEHMESAFIKLFQVLCESSSLAACRAYGSILTSSGRVAALKMAAEEFFDRRDLEVAEDLSALFNAYEKTSRYRNYIAHGMVSGLRDSEGIERGYYLSPPSHASRQRTSSAPTDFWWLTAKYFFNAKNIDDCTARFQELLDHSMRTMLEINAQFDVVDLGDLHP
jgi:hypothetical protein